MKIFKSGQIRDIDRLTISKEPVTSIDLMERAASGLLRHITARYTADKRIFVFAGPGNNGGDGLALARMLYGRGYEVTVFFIAFSDKTTDDWKANRKRLEGISGLHYSVISHESELPVLSEDLLCVDALLGSGLTRPAEGLAAATIRHINESRATVVSVDIPSGLFGEDNQGNIPENIIRADLTLTFQFPRLSFFFAENRNYTGEWELIDIGLDPEAIKETPSSFSYAVESDIKAIMKRRSRFAHKGNFGHGLLVAGSYGKMGAALLGARASMRSGTGLLTCHIPSSGLQALNIFVPEAMASPDTDEKTVTGIADPSSYDAVAVGPGMGTEELTCLAFRKLLESYRKPMVIDADGLNILAKHRDWLSMLPPGSVLTPHPGEFARLAGSTEDGYARLMRQVEFSKKYNCILVLKGAYSSVTSPEGQVSFNSTGNPGMATAGSGDVLTGIILSLLASGYDPFEAAIASVFVHGLAGDIAALETGYEALMASDLIDNLGKAFKKISQQADKA
ncbi:MAG: NAD(P)H-hydrate dehydratase [Bacteroidales bacterium]|nr:NAD(P)H-hydrate dehydratase [Bacteroidales bacterium]